MGKYDSLRKSHAPRHSAHALTPGLNYVPTICRSVLSEDGLAEQDASPKAPEADEEVWDFVLDGLEEELDEPLPVPELEETQVVTRAVVMQPIKQPAEMRPIQVPKASVIRAVQPKVKEPFDALAMLEAATIRAVRKK